jgi:Metal binding domain of Ada
VRITVVPVPIMAAFLNGIKAMIKKYFLTYALLLTVLFVACSGFGNTAYGAISYMTGPTTVVVAPTPPTNIMVKVRKKSDSPISPDPKLTPGDELDVTKEDICTPGYTQKVRNVPQLVKEAVFKEYGITDREPKEFEVDHLISLELGGSNSIKNLWPESYVTEPLNARVKDKVENKLHSVICAGEIDIKQAQKEIATDWISAYKKYVGPLPGNEKTATKIPGTVMTTEKKETAKQPTTKVSAAGAVVGNKNSKIYHRPDCPGFKTISEKNRVNFVNAAEAEKAGYRIAKNCPGQ